MVSESLLKIIEVQGELIKTLQKQVKEWENSKASSKEYYAKEKAKADIHAIWMAETKEDAEKAFDLFVQKYDAKYPKATQCLIKDRKELLTFYDFPAQHWHHLRTSNPIESMFATIRLRTYRTKGCLSRKTGLAMVYQLAMSAQARWPRLRGSKLVAEVINGIQFKDGVKLQCAA